MTPAAADNEAIALLSEDTKALCAAADYCKSLEDFDDWLDPMALIPAEEKLVAWRSLSANTRQGLTAAKTRRLADTTQELSQQPTEATAEQIQPQKPQQDASPAKVGAEAINLNLSPEWLLKEGLRYCGRYNRFNQLETSPLANSAMKGKSQAERDRVCDEYIQRMIVVLEVRKGPQWEELKRLAKDARKAAIALGCYCVPERCHCETIKLIIDGLNVGKKPAEIISELRASLPAKQENLLGAIAS